jgi:hypothetical protein
MSYRPKIKNQDGTLTDLPLEAETAVKLKTSRTIKLSGVTATPQLFDGSLDIEIPVTEIPATLLTGTGNININGTANTAKNYSSDGNIKSKFNSIDSSLTNVGKVLIGSIYYFVRTTTNSSDTGLAGYITFIL